MTRLQGLAIVLFLGIGTTALAQPSGPYLFEFIGESVTIPFDPAVGAASFSIELSIAEDPGIPTYPTPTENGFSMALQIDPDLLAVTGVEATAQLEAICDGPEFIGINLSPGCPGGVTIGVIYSVLGGCTTTFPDPTPLFDMNLTVAGPGLIGAVDPVISVVEWVNTCGGGVPPANILVVEGEAVQPVLVDAVITFQPNSVAFVRGDCNADGVLNIVDALALLEQLFLGAPVTTCPEACDIDGGSPFFDLEDGIALLSYLFTGGAAPVPPFPDCGLDPGAASVDCFEFAPCP